MTGRVQTGERRVETERMGRWLAAFCGVLLASAGQAENWPQFRGAQRDNIARETGLLRAWPADGPRVLWSVDVCEGYAGAAIHGERVYFNDYSKEANAWYVRCLDFASGRELWRYADEKRIRPNHGITRTVPAVDGKHVFALDPKCVFHCLDAQTGKELWSKNFVKDYGAKIPPWYNGQCPLIEDDRVVLGVGGEALMVALTKESGEEIWRTPNPEKWLLAHASVMPAVLGGVKQYLWCTLAGPLGVSAADGRLLWHHARKFNVAVAPSPLAIGNDRVLMTAGYDAGTVMLRVIVDGGEFRTETIFDWTDDGWNSEVHTPILYKDHLFAVGRKKRGLFTCLDLDGKVVWDSAGQSFFGLGSFLLADGMFLVLEGDSGMLRLLEASTEEYRELASAQVLHGADVWAPLALSDGKLVLRDMMKMVCVEIGQPKSAQRGTYGLVAGVAASVEDRDSPRGHKFRYRKVAVIAGKGDGPGQFAEALRGIAVDGENRLYAVGDKRVKVFSPEGEFVRGWETERAGYCVALGPDGSVYVGEGGQVERFDGHGKKLDTFRGDDQLGLATSVAVTAEHLLIGDVHERRIHVFGRDGRFIRDIGADNRMKGFMLPNMYLDFALGADGTIYAANPGQHRVEHYTLEGELVGRFGRFDGRDPAGFTGCCNPTNLALTPDGQIVTVEKADPRVKVYNREGELLAVVGEADLDPNCKNSDVAVDARGRIYVVDTVRLHVCVFAPAEAAGAAARPAASRAGEAVQP